MSTDAYMKNRALKSLSKEISSVSENLNTWAVFLKHLIKLRRKLIGSKKADSDLYIVADAFSKLFYKNHAKVNECHIDSDSEDDSDSASRGTSDTNSPRKLQCNAKNIEEEDIDETLRKIIASETRTSRSNNQELPENLKNITPMQQAALSVLTIEEQEAEDLANRMSRKREKLARDMHKPQPCAPVKFTLDVDKTLDPKTGKPIDCCVHSKDDSKDDSSDDEVLDEVSIDNSDIESDAESNAESNAESEEIPQKNKKDVKHPSAVDLETALKTVMKNVLDDTSLHPIIAMQKDNPLFNGLPGFDNNTGTAFCAPTVSAPTVSAPTVSALIASNNVSTDAPQKKSENTTQESYEFDPKYGPLLKLSAYARKQLQYKWFTRAKENVDAHVAEHPVSPRTRDQLIREETTRLQDLYCETH